MSLVRQLKEKGLIDREKATALEYEAKQSHKKEEELVLASGLVPEDLLFNLKSETLKIPLKTVEVEKVPLDTLETIPEETAKYYQMIPLQKKDNQLEIGMVYPEDLRAQEALKFLTRQGKFNYKVFLITPTIFNNLLRQYRNLRREVGMALEELETELKKEDIEVRGGTAAEYEKISEEAPVTKIVAVILRHAVEGKASDIHIEPTRDKLRVRFRLLGELHSSIFLPLKIHPAVIARIKIVSNLKIDETRVPQDGRFSAKFEDQNLDFRVSTFPTAMGEKVAIRVLDPATGLKSFQDLGIEERNLKLLKTALAKPFGLVLVTGPTGSGKSTTLYAALQSLNKEGVNIVTLEDPVEYFIEGINQSQIRPEINYDFATGLRHILRQDPNVIMVGEIRDEETAGLAIHAALTGHIVLSTLHTSNAAGAIPRLIDMGVKPYLISPTLQLAVAQRLIRRLCNECKKKAKPNQQVKELILKTIEEMPQDLQAELNIKKDFSVFEQHGCAKCGNAGFSGRIALYEMLPVTDALSDIIVDNPSEAKITEEAKKLGMITMQQDGIIKTLKGVTTIEEVLRVVEEK